MKPSCRFIQSLLLRVTLFVLVAAASGAAQQSPTDDQPVYRIKPSEAGLNAPQKFTKEGIAIEFSIAPIAKDKSKDQRLLAGADAQVTFRVSDAHTGQPVSGLRPNAWINARALNHAPNEAECRDKITNFIGGFLAARADANLNAYYLLTLNHDNTVTFINPQISFSATKLESIIMLPGRGADWALSKAKNLLYVSLPQQSQVVVINTLTRKIVATVSFSEKAKPMRIGLQPDGRYVWVGLDDSPNVAAIDTTTNALAATVPAGQGLHNLAFTEDSRFVYVTNSAADTVTAIDAGSLKKLADIEVSKTPVAIAYSPASRMVYVAGINGASINLIDPNKQQATASIPVKRGVVALRFDPEGRYGFAVNQIESNVTIIDAATNAPVAASAVVKGADQIAFTGRYAYIRGTESEKFSLIELSEARKGKLVTTMIQAGQKPPSASPTDIGVADMIVPTPEGNAVMIANAPDGVVYYYSEGLMAPSGTISNYKRRAQALMILDQGLAEAAPGTYTATVRLRRGGRFDVPMLIDQPRLTNCFQVEVADSPDAERQQRRATIAAEALFKAQRFGPGEPTRLRLKILDSITREPVAGLSDVHVLVFEPPGIWQQRQFAKEVDKGVYEVTQVFPENGLYRVMVQVESKGVRYADLPYTEVAVIAGKPEAGASANKAKEVKDQ